MCFTEIFIISIGLSLDVFVAVVYLGAGFSRINKKNLAGISLLFGGVQLGALLLGNLITLLPFFPGANSRHLADRWEIITVFIFAALGIYMISKGIRREDVLEKRNDSIDWLKTSALAVVTSVDALFAGVGLGFLDTEMAKQALSLFPVTVLSAILGIYAGYRLGLAHNRKAYWTGGALLLIASIDVTLHYLI